MDEFKRKGGVLGGREERYDAFDGEPKHIGGLSTGLQEGVSKRDSHHGDNITGKHAPHGDLNHRDGREGLDRKPGLGDGMESGNIRGIENSAHTGNSNVGGVSEKTKKPSLMDKLNPKIDADGDGKAGFMK